MFNAQYFGRNYWEQYYWYSGAIAITPIGYVQILNISSDIAFLQDIQGKVSDTTIHADVAYLKNIISKKA